MAHKNPKQIPIDFSLVQKLVGPIKEEQTSLVECYPWYRSGIFIPSVGHCEYAITKNHTHPSYSFILLTGESFSVGFQGKKVECSGTTGTVVAMGPDIPHHEEPQEQFSRYYAIMIDRDLFEQTWALYTEQPIPRFEGQVYQNSIDLVPLIKSYICELSDQLPGWQEQMNGLELRLAHMIIRTILPVEHSFDQLGQRFEVARACEFIGESFGEKLNLQVVAETINYSPSHFSKIFRDEVGKSVSDYILEVRMKAARRLLEQGKENLSEIAHRCGFSSPSHFSTAFRKYYGEKPSAFQKIFGKRTSV